MTRSPLSTGRLFSVPLLGLLIAAAVWLPGASASAEGSKPSGQRRVARYYHRHGVRASTVRKLLDIEHDRGDYKKFVLRGMKTGLRAPLPGPPKWWWDLSASRSGMSLEEEMEVGLMVAGRVLEQYKMVENDEATQYVNFVGRYVGEKSMRPRLNYRFVILEAKDPGAYSVPGGFVFITDGLIGLLENEDELAFVLAHEVSHVARFHGLLAVENAATRSNSRSAFNEMGGTDRGGDSGAMDLDGELTAITQQAFTRFMKFPERVEKERTVGNFSQAFEEMDAVERRGLGDTQEEKEYDLDDFADVAFRVATGHRNRTEEFESDVLGTDFLVRAGYDKEAGIDTLRQLKKAVGDSFYISDESTHPRFSEREEALSRHSAARWSSAQRRMSHTGRRFKEFKNLFQRR